MSYSDAATWADVDEVRRELRDLSYEVDRLRDDIAELRDDLRVARLDARQALGEHLGDYHTPTTIGLMGE